MSLWGRNGGVFLGYETDDVEGARPTFDRDIRYVGDRHLCLIAPNGSGKTKRLLVPALHDLTSWTCIINDIKGELGAMTRAHRAAAGSLIIQLNPFNVLGMGSDGFNPIGALELNEDFPDDALELAEAVIRIEGKEPHFAQAAQEFVTALIMYVRLLIPDGSFADVRALLGQDDKAMRAMVLSPAGFVYRRSATEELVLPGMVRAGAELGWDEIGIKASRFGDINPENKELHAVLSTALTQTRWLDSRPVKVDLGKNPFDFSVLKERPVTVYLTLPARRLGTHSTWLRLMVAGMIQKIMKDTRPPKVPVLLMMDEYAALAGSGSGATDAGDGFPVIARNMAMFRGFGIKLWTVWQDLAQAKRIYGDGFESFLANAGVAQFMATQDLVTSDYVSQRSGQATRVVTSLGISRQNNPAAPQGNAVSETKNVGQIPMPRILPHEVRNMDEGFNVIFSHKAKGMVRSYVPYPTELPHLRAICALDPGA